MTSSTTSIRASGAQGLDKFKAFNARMDHHYKEKLENIVVMVSKDGKRAAAEFNVHGVYKATDSGLPEAKGQKYICLPARSSPSATARSPASPPITT